MKKFLIILICLFSTALCFSEDTEDSPLNPIPGFPEIQEKPFVIFNEGLAVSQITRIILQDNYGRSNFVWQDFNVGASFEIQTVNMQPFNSIGRIAFYYPISKTFNGMNQKSKQVLLYGADLFYGIMFESDMWKYLRFKWAVGPHIDYHLSDEWHHVEAGLGAMLGTELPVARRWTALINGIATFDYGNLGSNRRMMPYSLVWQYQIEVGFRYSRKSTNTYSYIRSK